MSSFGVTIKGQDILAKHMKRMSNPRQVFDSDVRDAAVHSSGELVRSTPRKTGTTARAWGTPKKKADSSYIVENQGKTTNKKYSIPIILDKGRGPVRAKAGHRLYIPLSEKGRSKKAGAKIPKGFIWGTDYILVESVRGYSGTGYLTRERKRAGSDLARRMIKTIRREHS